MRSSVDKFKLSNEAAKLWLKCIANPTDANIKKIGSMQRKFNLADWDNFQDKVRIEE